MPTSGIKLNDDAKKQFDLLAGKEGGRLHDYIIFKLDKPKDPKEVIIGEELEIGKAKETYDVDHAEYAAMKAYLEANSTEPCWGACYFRYGDKQAKLIVILWCPDEGVPMKQKMCATSTHEGIKKKLPADKHFIVNGKEDLDVKEILEKVTRK